MKTISVALCFLTATLFAGLALAQGEPAAGSTTPPAGEPRPLREERLKRFDANHDGKLDDTERATARAEWQKRMAEHGGGPEGFRGPGGPGGGRDRHEFAGRGERGDEFHGRDHQHRHWRKMMRMRHWRRIHLRHAMLQRFDRDGDHHLSDGERGEARKAGEATRARFQAGRQQMLERFDANHDGKLDENERKGARDAWQEFLKQHPVLAAPAAPAAR